jgi:hypothetical protein
VLSLIKIEDMDQFLRALKLFYVNTAKRFYSLLLDYVLNAAVQNMSEVKAKKEAFKYIDTDSNIYNAFLLLALIMV